MCPLGNSGQGARALRAIRVNWLQMRNELANSGEVLAQLQVEYTGTHLPPVPNDVAIHLYRFAQEALTNVRKHAQARRVRVALEHEDGAVRLTVEDDGIGFPADRQRAGAEGGIGLIGLQERLALLKGRFEVVSEPGRGTRLVAWVPERGAP